MQIEKVLLVRFGALGDAPLEFAPQMTVVYGLNESAKTTFHSGIYAGLCGIRRARGAPAREDRDFAEQHRPWDGGGWKAITVARLADGRRIELTQELNGGVGSAAIDLALGRDISNEIQNEGTPDGSRWLGFTRRSFATTACVRQAQIVSVLSSADALQEELQRAAATAGRDATAAAAIQRLHDYSRDNVGLDRANSSRPLRLAIVELGAAKTALAVARERHAEYLDGFRELEGLDAAVESKTRELQLHRAATTAAAARAAAERAARARHLSNRYPEEPRGAAGISAEANDVASALALWENRPPQPDLTGRAVEQLEEELKLLPERPSGDLVPTQAVLSAETAWRGAAEALTSHDLVAPSTQPSQESPFSADELRALADKLETPVPAVDPSIRKRVEELERAASRKTPGRRPRARAGLGLLLAVFGVVILAIGSRALGAVLLVAGIAFAAASFFRRSEQGSDDAIRLAQQMLQDQTKAASEASRARAQAAALLKEGKLPSEPGQVRKLADSLSAAAQLASQRRSWEERRVELVNAVDVVRATLTQALADRGIVAATDDELAAALATYKADCADRSEQDRRARQRPTLEAQIKQRQIADQAFVEREAAAKGVVEVAWRLTLAADTAEDAIAQLRRWQQEQTERAEGQDTAQREWRELQMLLDGSTLEDLGQEAQRLDAEATTAATGFSPEDVERIAVSEANATLGPLQETLTALRSQASHARGDLERFAKTMPSVPETEERVTAAECELERVRHLEHVLAKAIEFLENAQTRVHQTIGPILQQTLRRWLPQITSDRYHDVLVDPQTLDVRVRNGTGPWRRASLLSEGTKEQIYLLLRVALAEHLTAEGEIAPLILDEITAQCDKQRRIALLQLLHRLADDRQIILFTHDDAVLTWASENLHSEHDRLVELDVLEFSDSPSPAT